MDKAKFIKVLSATCEIYGKELSKSAIDIYYNLLKTYSDEQVEKAFTRVLKTNKYNCLPKPAEIIELIDGKEEDYAILAWNDVIRAIRKYDYINSVKFQDKTIHVVIEHLGGWQWLCDQSKDNLKFIAKDFYRLYTIYKQRDMPAPDRLLGFVEQHNIANGYEQDVPKAKLISEEVKPKLGVTV